jgi:hypothetical protein
MSKPENIAETLKTLTSHFNQLKDAVEKIIIALRAANVDI